MTNEIAPYQHISSSRGAVRYFKSLLACTEHGLRADIRAETIRLAEKLAARMTFGASSSVRAEEAQRLIESTMYCIGYRLKSVSPNEGLYMLSGTPAERLWKQGRDMIRERAEQAKSELAAIKSSSFKTENLAYNDTIGEGIHGFLAYYDADFAAHESPGIIDYPLSAEVRGLSGIEYISEYIARLAAETFFCAGYSSHTEALLRCLGRDYREVHVNIYDLVLSNAAGRVLCGDDLSSFDISEAGRERLKASLHGMSKQRLGAVLRAAAERVCSLADVSGDNERKYARSAMKGISARVMNALETDSLDAVFLGYREEKQQVRFIEGVNMDDETFRAVTEELRECSHIFDKLAIIHRSVRSIGDLTDILGASCLFGSEFETVFSTLDDSALALLWLHIPEDGAQHVSEAESEWHGALLDYLAAHGKAEQVGEKAESIGI